MSEYSSVYVNPLSITYLANRKEIVITGFDKMETMTADDVEGTQLESGDVMLYDEEGDVIGYISILQYFQ